MVHGRACASLEDTYDGDDVMLSATEAVQSIALRAAKAIPSVVGPKSGENKGDHDFLLQRVKAHRRELLSLARAHAQGKRRWREARNGALQSYNGRVFSVLLAASKRDQKLSRAQIEALAHSIDPWQTCSEPLHGKMQLKKDGTPRWVGVLGVKRLALSYLVRDVLLAIWGPPTMDTAWRGRSTHEAIKTIIHVIELDCPWLVVTDIKACFPSIQQEGLIKWLPLPECVVRNSILISETVEIIVPSKFSDVKSIRETLRLGLIQGAPASALIASRIVQEVIEPISFDTASGHHSDNIWAVCNDEAEAVTFVSALTAGLKAHPTGELTLHDSKPFNVHESGGAKLLGYKVTTKGSPEDKWVARAHPAGHSFERHWKRLRAQLELQQGDLDDIAMESTSRWVSAWSVWKPSAEKLDHVYNQALAIAAEVRASQQFADGTASGACSPPMACSAADELEHLTPF